MTDVQRESVRDWMAGNALQLLATLVVAVLGYLVQDKLSSIETSIQTLHQTAGTLLVEQRTLAGRVGALEASDKDQNLQLRQILAEQTTFWRDYAPARRR